MKKTAKVSANGSKIKAVAQNDDLEAPPSWTFLTNHTHVLLCLYRQPDQRLRDVAISVGITERMVQRIVSELVEANYLHIIKEGRCNRYTVNSKLRLRHPLEIQHTIGDLLALLSSERGRKK